jgi:CRISPR/Cas system-associated protein Cas7 (RAMP superfamily)
VHNTVQNLLLVLAYLQKSLPTAGKLTDFLPCLRQTGLVWFVFAKLIAEHATNHIQNRCINYIKTREQINNFRINCLNFFLST